MASERERKIAARKQAKKDPRCKLGEHNDSELIAHYYTGKPIKEIAELMKVDPSTVKRRVKHLDLINRNDLDINNFEGQAADILKQKAYTLMNYITPEKMANAPLNVMGVFLGVLIDKIRLLEGKSTSNVAAMNLHAIEPEQLDVIKDAVKKFTQQQIEQTRKEYDE